MGLFCKRPVLLSITTSCTPIMILSSMPVSRDMPRQITVLPGGGSCVRARWPPTLSDHVWSLEEIVQMADNYMPKPGKRGPYKKRDTEGNTIDGPRIK